MARVRLTQPRLRRRPRTFPGIRRKRKSWGSGLRFRVNGGRIPRGIRKRKRLTGRGGQISAVLSDPLASQIVRQGITRAGGPLSQLLGTAALGAAIAGIVKLAKKKKRGKKRKRGGQRQEGRPGPAQFVRF